MTPVGEHVTHIHRWVPALVLPFRFIAAPHAGHLFALLDFVLMASSELRPDCWTWFIKGT